MHIIEIAGSVVINKERVEKEAVNTKERAAFSLGYAKGRKSFNIGIFYKNDPLFLCENDIAF